MSESHYPSNVPPTTKTLSDDDRLEFQRRYRLAIRKQKEDAAVTGAIVREAKNAGMHVTSLKASASYYYRDPEEIKEEFRELAHDLALHGVDVGIETTVSISEEAWHRERLWGAEDDGIRAGKAGEPLSANPCEEDTDLHIQWQRGHSLGVAIRLRNTPPTVKMADATPRRKLKKAATNGAAEHHANGADAEVAAEAAAVADAIDDAAEAPPPRRRGRPPGSPNKQPRAKKAKEAKEQAAA